MMPTGPWIDASAAAISRSCSQANCHGVVNPLLDVQPYLPSSVFTANYGNYEDPKQLATLRQDAARDRPRRSSAR